MRDLVATPVRISEANYVFSVAVDADRGLSRKVLGHSAGSKAHYCNIVA